MVSVPTSSPSCLVGTVSVGSASTLDQPILAPPSRGKTDVALVSNLIIEHLV
jgi:hypothetical protein